MSDSNTPDPHTPDAAVPPRPPMPDSGAPSQPTASTTPLAQPAGQGWYAQPHGQQPYGQHSQGPDSHGQHAPGAAFSSQTAGAVADDGHARPHDAKIGSGKIVAVLVAAAIVGAVSGLGGAAIGSDVFHQNGTVASSNGTTQVTVNDPDNVNQTTGIAAKTLPSVVTISATSSNGGGTGSGVILSEDGYVVTNTHVVTLDGASSDVALRVTTSDGRVYDAKVVGTDPIYDLAVIKLTGATGLTPIDFADSTKLNVGDTTVAVGAPLGLSNTVTTGIVSALNRSIQIASSAVPDSGEQQEDQGQNGQSPFQFDFGQGQQQGSGSAGTISIAVIQTDAAINPGNSGGALVDDEGKLIGINVAIATAGGGSSSSSEAGSIGVGFSIPSSVVKRVTDEIIKDGSATHGLLGAMVGNSADQKDSTVAGALVSDVTSGGAAAKAGLKAGDIVTEFNGVPVRDATDLTAQVRALAAGSDASVVYVRGGKSFTADVTLGKLTD